MADREFVEMVHKCNRSLLLVTCHYAVCTVCCVPHFKLANVVQQSICTGRDDAYSFFCFAHRL